MKYRSDDIRKYRDKLYEMLDELEQPNSINQSTTGKPAPLKQYDLNMSTSQFKKVYDDIIKKLPDFIAAEPTGEKGADRGRVSLLTVFKTLAGNDKDAVQRIENIIKALDFSTRSRETDFNSAVSKLIALKTVRNVFAQFNSTSAGFAMENLISAISLGNIYSTDSPLLVQDIIPPERPFQSGEQIKVPNSPVDIAARRNISARVRQQRTDFSSEDPTGGKLNKGEFKHYELPPTTEEAPDEIIGYSLKTIKNDMTEISFGKGIATYLEHYDAMAFILIDKDGRVGNPIDIINFYYFEVSNKDGSGQAFVKLLGSSGGASIRKIFSNDGIKKRFKIGTIDFSFNQFPQIYAWTVLNIRDLVLPIYTALDKFNAQLLLYFQSSPDTREEKEKTLLAKADEIPNATKPFIETTKRADFKFTPQDAPSRLNSLEERVRVKNNPSLENGTSIKLKDLLK